MDSIISFDDGAARELVATWLSAQAFAPFGDVIDTSGAPDYLINDGACGRFHDRARLDTDLAGRLGISLFESRSYSLPVTVDTVERHPLGSQAFLPMSSHAFVLAVAEDINGTPGELHAFITQPGQGVNLLRGTWHGVLTPLDQSGVFAVVDRIGPGQNCDLHTFSTPFVIKAPQ